MRCARTRTTEGPEEDVEVAVQSKEGSDDTGTWDGLARTPMDRGKLREPAQVFDGLGDLSDCCVAVLRPDFLIDVD